MEIDEGGTAASIPERNRVLVRFYAFGSRLTLRYLKRKANEGLESIEDSVEISGKYSLVLKFLGETESTKAADHAKPASWSPSLFLNKIPEIKPS
jgi:hypothetical protein